MADPYLDSKTGILRNLLGITERQMLHECEHNLVAIRMVKLAETPPPLEFNLKFLQKIHKILFEGIYDWAGKIRTVSISKGETLFCLPTHLESHANYLSKILKKENNFRYLTKEGFAEKAGAFLIELNMLHPFREGNGRTQRIFMEKIAQGAGFALDWRKTSQKEMIEASIEGEKEHYQPVIQIFQKSLLPRES
ncbi:cell filamentation protein Fic [Acetobacteraceae bacterium]|nr:cell filamentation protein Fic [Acetobacteraceae bacterium]